jgi:hypothetical protein
MITVKNQNAARKKLTESIIFSILSKLYPNGNINTSQGL